MKEISCLDKGYVRCVDHLGTDLRIVEAARVSYKSPSKGDEGDKKLLFYLYKNRHTSPFEQCSITFNIKLPIFVMRQFVRHRTFRLNEWSGRYSELADDFYFPEKWRKQDLKNKQGSKMNVDWDEATDEISPRQNYNEFFSSLLKQRCSEAYETYQAMLSHGVAKEMARIVLPVNIYTEIYVNCDLHNLLHFIRLREDLHAQYEISVYATAMKRLAQELFPWTFEAFEKFKFRCFEEEK